MGNLHGFATSILIHLCFVKTANLFTELNDSKTVHHKLINLICFLVMMVKLVMDNYKCLHGRNVFDGTRKHAVAWFEGWEGENEMKQQALKSNVQTTTSI